MNPIMMVSKYTLKLFLPVLFIVSVGATLAYFITSQVIVAANEVTLLDVSPVISPGGNATPSLTMNVEPGANFAVLWVAHRSTTQIVSATYDGNLMDVGCSALDGQDYKIEMFYLSEPPIGGHTMDLVFADVPNEYSAYLVSFSDVDLADPISDIACNSTTSDPGTWSTNPNVTITTESNDLVFAVDNMYSDILSEPVAVTDGTIFWNDPNSNVYSSAAYWTADDTSENVGFTYTGDAWPWGIAAIALKPTPTVINANVEVYLTDEGVGYLSAVADDINDVVTIDSFEYSYNNGITWIPLQESFLGSAPYGDSSIDGESGAIDYDFIPGSLEVRLRARDSLGTYWPNVNGTDDIDVNGTGVSVVATNNTTYIHFDVQDPLAARAITLLEYSLNGGSNWIAVAEASLAFPPYGDDDREYTDIDNSQIPFGTWDIIFRATDNNAEVWPKNEIVSVYDFDGTAVADFITIDLSQDINIGPATDFFNIDVYSDQGNLETKKVEYRLNGGDWIELPFNETEYTNPYFTIPEYDIATGTHNIEVVAYDQFNTQWGPESYDITIGTANAYVTYVTEGFEDNIGAEFTSNGPLYDEEYSNLVFGAPGGRIRITQAPFTNNSLGALTFDGPPVVNGSPGYAQLDLTYGGGIYTGNPSYNYMLEFDYMWHDDGSATDQSCIQNNNLLMYNMYDLNLGESVWTTVYNLYDGSEYGSYKHVSINLADVSGDISGVNGFDFRFTSCFESHADAINGVGGYSIDNLKVIKKIIGIDPDLTPPQVVLTDYLGLIPAPTVYNGELGGILSGTVTEDVSNIIDVEIRIRQIGQVGYAQAGAIADDGSFNSLEEDFHYSLFHIGDADLAIDIVVTTQAGEVVIPNVHTVIYDPTPPQISFTKSPGVNSGKNTAFAGTASDDLSAIKSINIEIIGTVVNIQPIYNYTLDPSAPQLSVDFDYPFQNLSEGVHQYDVVVENMAGSENTYSFTTTVLNPNANLNVVNYPETVTENTELSYTGTLDMAPLNIGNIQFMIGGIGPGNIEVPLTDTTPTDGAFDSSYEEFEFTTPALLDGVKRIFVQYEDEYGGVYFSGDFAGIGFEVDLVNVDAVDTTGPVIDLQPIIPNSTYDTTPLIFGKVQDYQFDHPSNIAEMYYQILGYHDAEVALEPVDGVFDEQTEDFYIESDELAVGTYQVEVRAVDAAGHSTLLPAYDFEVVEQEENIVSTKATKSGDFLLHTDHDLIASSEEIWGRDRLRLQQYVNIASTTALSTDNFGVRYGYDPAFHAYTTESNCSAGSWQTKDNGHFSFWDLNTATEYDFNIAEEFGLNNNIILGEIQDVLDDSGDCHVWITADDILISVNYGLNLLDGPDDYIIYDILNNASYPGFGSTGNLSKLHLDTRDPLNYGVYYRYGDAPNGGVGYIVPGNDVANDSDDNYANYPTGGSYTLHAVVDMYLDGNTLWLLEYGNGLVKINDNGTPLNLGDDSSHQYTGVSAYYNNFGINRNKSGNIVVAGDNGLWEIRENGDFDPSNDEVYQLLSTAQVENNVFTHLEYFPGDSIIGEQYFIGTRTDDIVYYGTNDTTEDKLDDELYLLDIAGSMYPTQVTDFFMRDENSVTAYLYRRGLYDIELVRDFADTGTAISKIYASLSGEYLDINHIKLLSVDFIDTAGSTSYRVSIDGGRTWKPITIGEQVFFTEPGYQIVFAIDMFEGSTPIISDFELEYSAYKDVDERGLLLEVDDEPDEVVTNTEFSFSVSALDELLNPLTQDQVVTLQLRSSTTNEVVDTFNVSSTLIQEGEGTVEISNAKAPVVGYHYIYAVSDTANATSEDINFIAPSGGSSTLPTTPSPALSFTASEYQIYKGEETTLNWTSLNLSNLVLTSDNDDLVLGNVVLNGTKALNLNKTTVFTLSGTGSYGNLTASLTVEVLDLELEELSSDDSEILLPEIIEFDATILEEVENGWLTEVKWKVINADEVEITDIGDNLPLVGSAQVIIEGNTTFVINASNDYGQASASDTVNPENDILQSLYAGIPFAIGAILTASVSLFLVPLSGTFAIDAITKFGVLFGVFRRKKKSYWGFVYDSKTSLPIPFAVINAYLDGKLISHTISDLDGKYGLLVEKAGEYTIEVKASGYTKYSKQTKVDIQEGMAEVVEDIELHKVEEKQNFLSKFRNYHKKEITQVLFFVMSLLMIGGFIYTVIITTEYPNAVNFLLLGLYGVFFTINLMSLLLYYAKTAGKVMDKETKSAIESASVRFYKDNKQVGIFLTNAKGILKINLSAGKYEYLAHKAGYKQNRMEVINVNEKGYLSDDILLQKA